MARNTEYVSDTIIAVSLPSGQQPPWTKGRANGRKPSEWEPIMKVLDDAPTDTWIDVVLTSARDCRRARSSITSLFSPKRRNRPSTRTYRIRTICKGDQLAIYKYQEPS